MFRPPAVPQWRRIATPIALAVVSLFAALVLWIAVSDAENPQTEIEIRNVPVRPVNVPSDLAVASITPATVTLIVRGDADLASRLGPADFEVVVDLTNQRESADLEIRGDVLTSLDVTILRYSQSAVRVELEQAVSKQVAVRSNLVGSIPQGYGFATDVSPASATVRGARQLVERVDYVSADVNLTGLRASLTQQVTLVPRDARGLQITRVSVEPARAETRVTVQQQEVTVQVPVVASLQGALADGYNITRVVVDPAVVPVSGTLETTQALSSVSTEPIDVSGLSRDASRTVRLRLPSGVQSSRDTVTVRLSIAPAQGELLLYVAPQVTNLGDGLNAVLQTSTVALRLSGDVPALRSITPGSVRATVNASGRQEGVHVIEPQITGLPQGVQVSSIDPSQVVVVVRR